MSVTQSLQTIHHTRNVENSDRCYIDCEVSWTNDFILSIARDWRWLNNVRREPRHIARMCCESFVPERIYVTLICCSKVVLDFRQAAKVIAQVKILHVSAGATTTPIRLHAV